jgi:hypothetical protein
MSSHFKSGEEFYLSGLHFRIREGNKKPGDLVMEWRTLEGWLPVKFDAIGLLVEFLYYNEEHLYPQPQYQGGRKVIEYIQKAIKHGHVAAWTHLEGEKKLKAIRQFSLFGDAA